MVLPADFFTESHLKILYLASFHASSKMSPNSFYNVLKSNFPFQPTYRQDLFFKDISDFIATESNDIFVLKGYAGTGKTTVISTIVNHLHEVQFKYVLMAPTGRAVHSSSV